MAEKVTDPALLAQLNDGAPQPVADPETLAALNSDMHPDDAGALHSIRSALHAADPYVRAIANGMTLGLADRFAAGMESATGVGGKEGDYAGNLTHEQGKTDQFANQHPIGNAVAQTAGALATFPFMPVGGAVEGASLLGKAAVGAGVGAGYGGLQGAFSSKDLTDLPQTMRSAAWGVIPGAILGGTTPVAGAAAGKGLNWLADAVRSTPGISRSAAPHLLEALQADGPMAVQSRMDQLGPDAMLVDAGPALKGKGQGVVLNSDKAKSTLNTALTRRDQATNSRIMGDINGALGPAEDPQTVSDAILAHRSAVDNVNYQKALDGAAPVRAGDVLSQIDKQIPRSVGMERKALENLRDMMSTVDQKATDTETAAASSAATVKNDLAATVKALRAKFGDVVADKFESQQPTAPPQAASLLQFIASKGGLHPDPELDAIGLAAGHRAQIPGRKGFFNVVGKNGADLDRIREAAEEAGYLRGGHNQTSTVRDLLDAIDAEMRGNKRYPEGFEGSTTKREATAQGEQNQFAQDRATRGYEDDLAAAGHHGIDPDVRQRAMDLMANEGLDADSAVDRAVTQLDQEQAAGRDIFLGDRQAPKAVSQKGVDGVFRTPKDDATVLHKVKQELDNVIEYDAPGLGVPAGAVKNQQGMLKWFRGQINGTLEKQVPGYREANAASSALAKRAEAVKAGTQFLGSGKTTPSPSRFAGQFDPLSQGEKIAFAKGSRGEIERVVGTKGNDLQALRGELQGEGGWNTAKLATVHGQEAADQLVNSVDRNLAFRDTYNKVVENSQTAQRLASAKGMTPEPSDKVSVSSLSKVTTPGMVLGPGKWALDKVANALMEKDATKSFGEVAKILSASGPEARLYLHALQGVLNRRAAFAPGAARLGDRAALVAAMGTGKYLAGPYRGPNLGPLRPSDPSSER